MEYDNNAMENANLEAPSPLALYMRYTNNTLLSSLQMGKPAPPSVCQDVRLVTTEEHGAAS